MSHPPTAQTLDACEKALGYRFQDQRFLVLALTHASAKTEEFPSNERLEFFGDSVLGLVVSEHLYKVRPDWDEGNLTEVKSAVVSRETLNKITMKLGFLDFMSMGRGVHRHGAAPVSVGANVYEGLVGAIYLDGGLAHARRFCLNTLREEIDSRIGGESAVANAKSGLQQMAQRKLGASPNYRVVHEHGSSHGRRFEVAVFLRGKEYGRGEGGNKKEAEMRAAEAALKTIESGQEPVATVPPVQAAPAGPQAKGRGRGRGRGRAQPAPKAEAAPAPAAAAPPPSPPVVSSGAEIPIPPLSPGFGAGILDAAPPAAVEGGAPKKPRRRGRRGGRRHRKKPAGPASVAPQA